MKYVSLVVFELTDNIGEYVLVEKVEHDYDGPIEKCCGPSGAEESLEAQSQSLSSTLSADFNSRFANQNEILSTLNNSLSPIVAAGPNAQGMSAAELANLNSTAISGSAAAARNARQAAGNLAAGQNSSSGLTSGITKQIDAAVDSNAANQLATAQNQIQAANYATGRDNFFRAEGGLSALAGEENPEAFGSQAVGANSNAFGEANTVQQQKNQEQAAIAGGITSLATNFVAPGLSAGISAINPNADTSVLDALCWVAAELYGGWSAPKAVCIRTWLLSTSYMKPFVALYKLVGRQWAEIIRKNKPARNWTQKLFDWFLIQSQK